MIQLHPDYLFFQTKQGETIPCSAESVTIELIGDAASILDPQLVREAASAVVHYFKVELGRETVSVAEFSKALERVLNGLGFTVTSNSSSDDGSVINVSNSDLVEIFSEARDGFELLFFLKLREEFRRQMKNSPDVLRFRGLKRCVKQLVGMKRWGRRCEAMSDQIVGYLRECLEREAGSLTRGLVVR
jgi:hypothetical protein